MIHWLIVLILSASTVFAATQDSFQKDIDVAIQDIMLTRTGQTICQKILGGDSAAIAFHLGVSDAAAEKIAAGCTGEIMDHWYYPTSPQDIRKLNLKNSMPRKYELVNAEPKFPIESWTDPFSNTTVLLTARARISHERLVQLLAHEMAVYFDSKANPAHPDAQNIPQLRDLNPQPLGPIDPLVAVTDPLIAHTLTFVRALQVEFSIVDELVQMHKTVPPVDYQNSYLRYLVSDKCQEECLEDLVTKMHDRYLPIGLPLLAFAPHFRTLIGKELNNIDWSPERASLAHDALVSLPGEFLRTQFTGNPLADIQRVFSADENTGFATVSGFLNESLWPLEKTALKDSRVSPDQSLLEFMKVPLLSGYNILLSSGPRVRVTTGNAE